MTCQEISLEGSTLKANCRNIYGDLISTQIDLSPQITNHNGILLWSNEGNYAKTSKDCRIITENKETLLHCQALKINGQPNKTFINLDEHITNINGALHYQ